MGFYLLKRNKEKKNIDDKDYLKYIKKYYRVKNDDTSVIVNLYFENIGSIKIDMLEL